VAFTLVSFHAHPDDEALLTGGTLARAAAEGHRVGLVTATDGAAGLSAGDRLGEQLADRRRAELELSAAALGCARVAFLGYPDSGSSGPVRPGAFASLEPAGPAARLAAILRAERADVLTTYDAHGGYGHRDHVQVNLVGAAAAALAGTRVLLEATVDRARLRRAARLLGRLPWTSGLIPEDRFAGSYSAPAELTHEVDVRRHLAAKRAALRAHLSQAEGGVALRTVELLLALPSPVFAAVLGREWFREAGRPPGRPLLDDVFASLR
jgi:LmbE family N-acetylglucosaminyl deacetylase